MEQGESLAVVSDGFEGTTAKILDGVNGSVESIYDGRATAKDINTGWTSRRELTGKLASHVLTLWGLADYDTEETDVYVLSMNYDGPPRGLGHGRFGIASQEAEGNWVNAVDRNLGGTKKFVVGAWKPQYGLGTYGIDPSSQTAWAVVNYEGDFAVARNIEPTSGRHR